jgi:hypothetical protein
MFVLREHQLQGQASGADAGLLANIFKISFLGKIIRAYQADQKRKSIRQKPKYNNYIYIY